MSCLQSHFEFVGSDNAIFRPRINEGSLSVETTTGTKYRLDESLFERIAIDPLSTGHSLPYSKLSIQRRMHPDISAIPKEILYPLLQDHISTHGHPGVPGFWDRSYFFHHTAMENDCTVSQDARYGIAARKDAFGMVRQQAVKSHTNMFEVGMIAGLVRYLVGSNMYGLGDIAILVSSSPSPFSNLGIVY